MQQLNNANIKGESTVKLAVQLDSSKSEYEAVEKIWKQHKTLLDDLRVTEARYQEVNSELDKIKIEGKYKRAAFIQYDELPDLESKLDDIKTKLHELKDRYKWLSQVVGQYEIASVLSQWTGIPLDKIIKSDNERLLLLTKGLTIGLLVKMRL